MKSNFWFGTAMLLTGFIIGSVVTSGGEDLSGWLKLPALPALPAQDAPSVPTPPSPPSVPNPNPTPNPAPDTAAQDAMIPLVDPKRDHIRGNADADVAVIEYSDLECPFCERVHPTLKQLIGDDANVQWVYRHFPLGPHKNARRAAEAVECAGNIGGPQKFWEMVDVIFLKGPDGSKLGALAEEIGVSTPKMEDCLAKGTFTARVQEDMDAAEKAGVNGTPSNFVVHIPSGRIRRVMGAQPITAFTTAIEAVRSGDTSESAADSSQARSTLYTVPIRVEEWAFTPGTVRVKKGDTVTLRFVGTTGTHTIVAPGLNIETSVSANEQSEVSLPTTKLGAFTFQCVGDCTVAHPEMKGTIIVEE